MADQSDVEQALATLANATLYPTGLSGNPPLTIVGCPARIGRGWPNQAQLDADLAAGVLNITVFPRPGMERNATRYLPRWMTTVDPHVTVTAAVAGQTVTLGGTISQPQNIAIKCAGRAFAYAVQAGDTLAAIAATLASAISAVTPASAVGAVITIPNVAKIAAAVGGAATVQQELVRVEKAFQLIVWAPNPTIRDAAAKLLFNAIASTTFIALADGTAGRIRYQGGSENDAPQKELLYRRDLFFTVEYGAGPSQTAYQIVVMQTNLEDADGDVLATEYE